MFCLLLIPLNPILNLSTLLLHSFAFTKMSFSWITLYSLFGLTFPLLMVKH